MNVKPLSVKNDTQKVEQLSKEIADLKEEGQKMRAKWSSEKALIDKIQQSKIDIEQLKYEADRAEREVNYGK